MSTDPLPEFTRRLFGRHSAPEAPPDGSQDDDLTGLRRYVRALFRDHDLPAQTPTRTTPTPTTDTKETRP